MTMETKYILREDVLCEEELGSYRAFGITCKKADGEEHIPDISTDRELVEAMISKFNRYHLSPIHLRDAIEEEIE